MKRNYIPTIDLSSLTNSNFKSKKSIQTINKIEKSCKKTRFIHIHVHVKKVTNIYKEVKKFTK